MVTLKLPKASLIVDRINIDDYFEPDAIEELEGNPINEPLIMVPFRNIYNEKKWLYFKEIKDKAFKEYIKWLKQAPDFINIVEVDKYLQFCIFLNIVNFTNFYLKNPKSILNIFRIFLFLICTKNIKIMESNNKGISVFDLANFCVANNLPMDYKFSTREIFQLLGIDRK